MNIVNDVIKILAIDDIHDNILVLRALIAEAFPEIKFVGATSGHDGLEICRHEIPDVVLLDIVMPGMDGFEVCKALKSDPLRKNIPVVMITAAKTDREFRIRGLECGADGFLTKPVDTSELTAQIRAMIRLKEGEDRKQNEKQRLEELVKQRTEALENELEQRRKAEESIQRTEKYFRTLIEKAPDGIVLIGADLKFRYASPSARRIFGYSETESIFFFPSEFTHPDDLPMVRSMLKNVIRNPLLIPTLEYRFQKKDGSWLWVESTFTNQLYEDGIEAVVVNFRDITQRKKIEDTQQFLLSAGWTNSGDNFFQSLARYLAVSLGMNYVCINRILSDNLTAQSLAVYHEGNYPNSVIYSLRDTPHGEVVGKNICCFEHGVRYLYPQDAVLQEIEAECYFGTTLWSSEGKPIGLIALMDSQPLENRSMVESVINLVSIRAAGELGRLETESALMQSRMEFQNYFENCSVGMSVTSPEKKWLEVNQSLCRMLGHSKEELVSLNWVDLTYPEDIDRNLKLFAEVTEGKSDRYELDKRFVRKDGSLLYVTLSTVCERNPDGSIHHLLSSYVDVTARHLAEEAIRQERSLLRTLINNLPDRIFVKDWLCRKIVANKADLDHMGYISESEILGKTDTELFSNTDGVLGFREDLSVIQSGIPLVNQEKSFFDSSGMQHWMVTSKFPFFDENRKVQGLVGIAYDITKRKLIENKLRILSQAIEQNPASTIITDATGKIEFVNTAFTVLTQYSLENVINRPPRIFNRGHIPDDIYNSMWENLLAGKVWKGEFQNRRKDGFSYWENVTISSLMTREGVITNYILIMEDTSEKKAMFDDLIAAKETAEESNRLKSAFLAMMNHELRTPLNHILGFSELIMSNVAPGDNISFASSIQTSGQSLLSIIEGVFDMAQVEQGNIKLRKQTFSLMDHFMENKASFDNILRASAKHDQIQLIFRPDTRWLSCYVTTDRSKINQVLTNLFKNAVKFTHKGSIEFGYKIENESSLIFYVKDTGIGIPEEKQSVIFDFFRQGDDSNTRVYGGIGIGLAISTKITKILQGELKVVSAPDQGSTFTLSIPVELSVTKN